MEASSAQLALLIAGPPPAMLPDQARQDDAGDDRHGPTAAQPHRFALPVGDERRGGPHCGESRPSPCLRPGLVAGHVPMSSGEWVALPVLGLAAAAMLDALAEHVNHPTVQKLLERCHAVRRLTVVAADQDVAIAHDRGTTVHHHAEIVPVRISSAA